MDVYALVAQGIEQWFPVPRVGGSNPSGCVWCFGEKHWNKGMKGNSLEGGQGC